MNNFLSQKEVEAYWDILVKKNNDLFIFSLSTNNLSKKWEFFFRNKILELTTPDEVKISTIEFNKEYCERESIKSKSNSNYLSIHSIMLRDITRNLSSKSYCLIIDIDAFPLSEYAIKLTFVLAMLKGINGNIQRTNCIDNGSHLFIGPSYICFNAERIKDLKDSAWIVNERSDVGEEITWLKPDLVDHNLFKPIKTVFKPIWSLENSKKVYGIGTTFGYDSLPVNYHHFYSRNAIARLHFFLISFSNYLSLKIKMAPKNKFSLKNRIRLLIYESKFAIRYILGKI